MTCQCLPNCFSSGNACHALCRPIYYFTKLHYWDLLNYMYFTGNDCVGQCSMQYYNPERQLPKMIEFFSGGSSLQYFNRCPYGHTWGFHMNGNGHSSWYCDVICLCSDLSCFLDYMIIAFVNFRIFGWHGTTDYLWIGTSCLFLLLPTQCRFCYRYFLTMVL